MARLPQIATDLAELRLNDLLDLQQRVAVAMVERRQTERADLKAKFTALAAEAGLSLDDVLGLREAAAVRRRWSLPSTGIQKTRRKRGQVAAASRSGSSLNCKSAAPQSKILQSDWSQQPPSNALGNH